MDDISKPKVIDWSNGIPANGMDGLLSCLDQQSFEYFNQGREEKGKPRITREAWDFLKTLPVHPSDADRQRMRELGI